MVTQDQKGPLVNLKNCTDCHVAGNMKDDDIVKS